jgi:hypothetical protein
MRLQQHRLSERGTAAEHIDVDAHRGSKACNSEIKMAQTQ